MAVDWGSLQNHTPIQSMLRTYDAMQAAQGEKQRQRLAENQDKERTSQYGVDQGYVKPKYDENGNFQGYEENAGSYGSDLPMFKKTLPQMFPQGGGRGTPDQGGGAQPSPPTTQQPGSAPPSPQESIRTAASPERSPGDPKPILTDPKVNHEIAKNLAQNPAPGTVIQQGDVGGPQRVTQQNKVSFDEPAQVEASVPPPPTPNQDRPSPFMMNRIGGYMTTMPHYQMDPEIGVDTLPDNMRKSMGIPDDFHGSVRRSLLEKTMESNTSLERARITANGLGLPPESAPYLDGVTRGVYQSPGDALQHFEQDHGQLAPRQEQNFVRAANSAFGNMNQNRNFGLRAENQSENQSGKGAQAVDNNPIARQYQQRYDGAGRALDLIGKMRLQPGDPNYVMPSAQNLHMLMNEVGRLETGTGSVAEGNLEKGEITSKQAELTALMNKWTNNDDPAQIAPQLIQAEQLITALRGDYAKNRKQIIDQIASGRGPKQAAAVRAKGQTAQDQTADQPKTFQAELSRAQELLSQHAKDPNFPTTRRRVEVYLQQKYGKGLGAWQPTNP